MKEINLKALLLLMLCSAILLIAGCAGLHRQITFPEPGQDFRSSNEEAIIFGRLEVLLDGFPLPLNPSSLRIFSLEPFLENRLNSNHVYIVDISPQNGYFAAKLPPGKYVVDMIHYRIRLGSIIHNMRTSGKKVYDGSYYSNILNYSSFESAISEYPVVLVFEVFPGNATYLGTIQAINDRRLYIVKWGIKSDYARAIEVFHTLYPNHKNPVENPFEIRPCRTVKNNNILLTYLCLPIESN